MIHLTYKDWNQWNMDYERGKLNSVTGIVLILLCMIFPESLKSLLPLGWVAFGILLLILTDTRFGIEKSRLKKIEVRRSRSFRRVINKIFDYGLLLIVFATIQILLYKGGIVYPWIPLIIFLLIGIFEIESIINNWLIIHNRKEIDIIKLIKSIIIFKLKHKK